MTEERRSLSFVIDQRFDIALRMLRRAIAMEGLRVPCELDTAARLKQELGVGLAPNIVLYIDDPIQLLEATVMAAAGGLFIPEPIVLSDRGDECSVSVRSIQPVLASDLPASVRGAVASLHERILAAIQRVGQKEFSVGLPIGEKAAVPA